MAVEIGLFQFIFNKLMYISFLLTPALIFFNDSADRFSDKIKAAIFDNKNRFDFVVVGGGSSGLVVATRLSENFNVLLLEAGGEPYKGTYTPGNIYTMLNHPEIDWQFTTVPQENACLAMNNQQSKWHRGLGLGGSSNLNFLQYARGHPEDYNLWANITGDSRWMYENLLPYFKKSENYHSPTEWVEETSKYHGKGGPLTVKPPDYLGMGDYVIQAAKELGYPVIDFNSNFPEGFSTMIQTLQLNGYRMGVFQAFLQPIRSTRTSLTIHKFAFVKKLLFKEESNSVVGVEYTRHGEVKVAYAQKEVILSAGAIGSPKILLASGIGPKEHLKSLGIEVMKDLPVGKNLQDHVHSIVGPFIVNETITYNQDRDLTLSQWIDYYVNGKGVLATTGHYVSGFISTRNAKESGKGHWPDLQIVSFDSSVSDGFSEGIESNVNIQDGLMKSLYENAKGLNSFFLVTILNRPVSRGELLLKSRDPQDPPLINPNYFQEKQDLTDLIEGINFCVDLVEKTKTFQSMDGHLMKTPFSRCKQHEFKSNEYWKCFARQFTFTTWHYSGTCAMGKMGSENSVVNSELEVTGIDNLRVIDASIMPTVVSSNTNAACILIGEYGGDLIKKKYLKDLKNNKISSPHNQEL